MSDIKEGMEDAGDKMKKGAKKTGNKRESRLISSFQHIIFILLLPSYLIN
jgi:hypothetical protein